MKYLLVSLLAICSQLAFAQYKFKYNSRITTLENVGLEGLSSRTNGYATKMYKTNLGDTLTIEPKISLIVQDEASIDEIVKPFGDLLSFQKKIGRVYIYSCAVSNSDEVLKITTSLCDNEDVLGCEAMYDAKFRLFNSLYSQQYYLNNPSGVDINVESAWKITSELGRNVVVAVIDEGVEHCHEDLPNVLDGYTAGNSGNGEPLLGHINAHGTSCAGIIAAANNSVGIRGIASNAKILPVNVAPDGVFVGNDLIAEAILWAGERADVLSCSWGGQGSTPMVIAEAIQHVMKKGRGGKGCVVVFAAGNNAQIVSGLATPACEPGVISVGAVHKNGIVWDYSQRGDGLTLVAPSGETNLNGDVVTTDRMGSLGYDSGNYVYKFGGTSAACPQVAGVAALLLSVRPDLSVDQVKEVLQKTATDLGASGYDATYGYGLLNAYAAVKEVAPCIIEANAEKGKITFNVDNLPSGSVVSWDIPDKDSGVIKMIVTGEGNKQCVLELLGSKTVRTTLSATVTLNDTTLIVVSKVISLMGTFSGTYNVTETTVNGVNFPAIINRPFYSGSTLEAHAGATVTITSDDLYTYKPSWSGVAVENWTYSYGNILSFTYPITAKQGYTNLTFKNTTGGSNAMLRVYLAQPSYSMSVSLNGASLRVNISQNELLEDGEQIMPKAIYDNHIWTVEVVNVATGIEQGRITMSMGECLFYTSGWPSGIYLVRATDGENNITEKVVVK